MLQFALTDRAKEVLNDNSHHTYVYACACSRARFCVCMCKDIRNAGLIRGMQPHKNSTPLGIHTRRRVASMRCSATAFKKGKQKLHHRPHRSMYISVLPWRMFRILACVRARNSKENYTLRNALCPLLKTRIEIKTYTLLPRSSFLRCADFDARNTEKQYNAL